MRTHPPVQYAFPPVPHIPTKRFSDVDSDYGLSDSDDARDAIIPGPWPRRKEKENSRPISRNITEETGLSESDRYVNVQSLLQHTSRYITLDETRITAFSPSAEIMLSSGGKKTRTNRLPNVTAHLDLKALNLHLALRTAEITACSEAMWEWVVEYKESDRMKMLLPESRDGHLRGSSNLSLDAHKSITELTREDFDNLIGNFNM